MRKFAIYLLDAFIFLALTWLFLFRDIFESFWAYVAAIIALMAVGVAVSYLAIRKEERSKQQKVAREKQAVAVQTAERQLFEQRNRERLERIDKAREANRPACGHCGKPTEWVYQHVRVDGSQDRRYRINPMLCNRCRQPYDPVRPSSQTNQAKVDE